AAVVGAIQSAFFSFNHRVDAVGIGAGNRNANPAQQARRQTVPFQPLPGAAAIGGFVQTAAGAAAAHAPWLAHGLVERGKQHVGVVGIEGDVNAAGLVVFAENLLPVLATIG